MLDLFILEQFVTFYHTGTLCETAGQLHISQSTLTRSMQKLESEFGVSLFQRTKNSITFTDAGRLAATEAELILHQCKNMLQRVRDFDRKSRTISIGSCAPFPVSELVRQVSSLFPETGISSELKPIQELTEGLHDGTYQLIILPCRPVDPELMYCALCKENLFFYLHKQHRYASRKSLAVSEMNGENMLLFQDIGFWYDLVRKKMPDSRFLMQTERYSFGELILNSTLPVFTSDAYPKDFPDSERVRIPITDPEFHITYYLACKKADKGRFRFLFAFGIDKSKK